MIEISSLGEYAEADSSDNKKKRRIIGAGMLHRIILIFMKLYVKKPVVSVFYMMHLSASRKEIKKGKKNSSVIDITTDKCTFFYLTCYHDEMVK
jgi:hypothetical protein